LTLLTFGCPSDNTLKRLHHSSWVNNMGSEFRILLFRAWAAETRLGQTLPRKFCRQATWRVVNKKGFYPRPQF